MEITGTPQQIAFGLALANFVLLSEVIAIAVRRGDMKMNDAADLFGSARQNVHKLTPLLPIEAVVLEIATNSLGLQEQIVRAYSAETPPSGAH